MDLLCQGGTAHCLRIVATLASAFQQEVPAGIFESTTGKIEVTFPFTEHATILEGEVQITDASGTSHTYAPGDSYLIRQGDVVLWEVRGPRVRKSFFNITR